MGIILENWFERSSGCFQVVIRRR